ncbi:uncharacterized protein si:ch211-13c6.2 [Hippoglossus hippoglossus]|uniref:uncharacterized protein si:ch211-13c6.2 n=1 Tax=Hippoglossus hippoglossus TaxID=8267 RepID=UPI00148C581A|nr:uncharacterized protein si:ch211-13c6.2 [Hippoglossus hippoglossus]
MDKFETPYDVEADFIECTVCDKSIRGDTLYKIHMTTPGHIKKEEGLVTSGLAARKRSIPDFKDILQYLEYLKLNEPIIGLSYLEEVPCNDEQENLRYLCRLCHLTVNLVESVHHVIGRKHRQKYVEIKRPDLVTWDKQSIIYQAGKIIRTRAEIVERQDGRGNPTPMAKKGNESKSNTSRVPPRQKQNSLTPKDVPPLFPDFKANKGENSDRGYQDMPSFHTEEPSMNKDRQMYQREDGLSRGYMKDELHSADYMNNNMYRQEYIDPGKSMQYEEEYVEDPQIRDQRQPCGGTRYDPWEEVPMPHGQTQDLDYFPEEAPPYRRPHPERDALTDLYSEEVRRRKARSEYEPSQPAYPDDERRWSLDRESGRHDDMSRASGQGSSEPEAKRRSFSTPMENDLSHDHLFDIIKDYRHKKGELCEEMVSNPGMSRTGPPSSQRRVDVTKTISGIPEPFRRFLTGATNDEGCEKRKRKSRFSDATAEEVERTKEIFSKEYGHPNPKFGGHPRPVSESVRPEIHGTQHPDHYRQSQSQHHPESYHREGLESEGVFDLLKGIEIENAEEADFLKNKLCSLLREFKSKKSEKTVHNSQGGAVHKNEYNSLNPDLQLPPRHQYDGTRREDSDHRRSQDTSFQDGSRGRGWQQHEYMPVERRPEHHHSPRKEPEPSSRSRYEEAFGRPGMSRTQHVPFSDKPEHYPERFQEPMHPRGYRPAAGEYFDCPSAPLRMAEEPRMQSGSRYSTNLDKITSTLLELVARKQQ